MKKRRGPLASHALTESLHAAGLRVTGPRLAILELLRHDRTHPTAEQVYQRLHPAHPGLSLSTVYNALEAFSRRGLCRRLPSDGGSQRFDGTTEPHHHALCTRCGRIFDLPVEVYEPLPPPPHLGRGLEVRGVQVTFEVTCTDCRQAACGTTEMIGGSDPPRESHTQSGGVLCPI